MKTQKHFTLTLVVLFVTACASKRDIASSREGQEERDQAQHAQMIEGQASRLR
jgi:outer membrane biogenesis lipoprotein LolB